VDAADGVAVGLNNSGKCKGRFEGSPVGVLDGITVIGFSEGVLVGFDDVGDIDGFLVG